MPFQFLNSLTYSAMFHVRYPRSEWFHLIDVHVYYALHEEVLDTLLYVSRKCCLFTRIFDPQNIDCNKSV